MRACFSLLFSSSLALERDDSSEYLSLVMVLFVMMATLLLSGAAALEGGLVQWRGDLTGRITLQILYEEGGDSIDERASKAISLLQKAPSVKKVERVDDMQMSALLQPWLGGGDLPKDLPIPALIDISLVGVATPHILDDLKKTLQAVPHIQLDDHGDWLQDVRNLVDWLVWLSYGLVIFITGTAMLIVTLLVRSNVDRQSEMVELLHLVGATDALISWQFERHMALITLKGGVLGSFVAFIAASLVSHFIYQAEFMQVAPWNPVDHWPIFVVMPCVFVVLALLCAKRVCRRMLVELP